MDANTDANTNLKDRLPGRHVTEGPARPPRTVVIRTVVIRTAQENAAAAVAASGAPAHVALHLPAIADECGIAFDSLDVAESFKRTSYIADLKPAGRFVAKDLFETGSVPLLMKTLLDNGFMHGDCMTVTGYSMAQYQKRVAWNSEQDVVRPAGVDRGNLEVQSSDAEFEKCRAAWQPRGSGYLWKYAQSVGSARHGAVAHPGRAAEKACYADI